MLGYTGENMLKLLDRILFICAVPLFLAWCFLYKLLVNINEKHKSKTNRKNILFLCSGAPYAYPKDKVNDPEFKKNWSAGFRSQLLHPTFDFSYAIYLGAENTCYKLCPGIVTIVLKKTNLKLFPKFSTFFNSIKIIVSSTRFNSRLSFYTIETFMPGDRMLDALFVSKNIARPLVIQCQGDFDLSYFDEDISKETVKKSINRNLQKILFSIVLKHASLVLGYNDHCASFTICNGASPHKVRRCRVASFIEDFDNFDIKTKEQLNDFPLGSPTVLLWCRLAPEKKLKYSVEAMKEVFRVNRDIKLLIAGDGQLKEYFEEQTREFSNNVFFLGNLERSQLKSYIANADVCLVPIGGHSLIEAGMCKKPVVAFNWEWHGEVITNGESGLLVDYPNVEDFKDAVLYILNNPSHAKSMGEKLHCRILKLFNRESVIGREMKIWNEFHPIAGWQ